MPQRQQMGGSQSELESLLQDTEYAESQQESQQESLQDDSKISWYARCQQIIHTKYGGLSIIACIVVFILLLPWPDEIQPKGKPLLAIFVATIGGILLRPLPSSAVVIIALTAATVTHTLDFNQAFEAFGNQVPWLVMTALWIAKSIEKSNLGQRLGYFIVAQFGGSPLGLVYGLVFCEAILSPAIPSVTARAGGIILPVLTSVAEACGSYATDESANLIGAYLILTINFTAAVTSTMTLTGNHPNVLTTQLTQDAIDVDINWPTWAKGAVVPGVATLLVLPLVVYALSPPKLACTKLAQQKARQSLQAMGAMRTGEMVVVCVMVLTVGVWVSAEYTGIPIAVGALLAVSTLLLFDIISWEDCVSNNAAWSTFTWFSGIIALAKQLRVLGLIGWLSEQIQGVIGGPSDTWYYQFIVLVLMYYYFHYMFAGNAPHASALFTAFLSISIAVGAPPVFAALVLSYVTNIMGTVTTYGMTHCPMYFEKGYVPIGKWMLIAFVVSVVQVVVWIVVGGVWWRVIGFTTK